MLSGYFEHQERLQIEGHAAEPLECVPSPEDEGVCGWYHCFRGGEKQRAGRCDRKGLEVDKEREVEEKGLKLSITGGGKEGKSKVIALCSCLEDKFGECSKKMSGVDNECRNAGIGFENENEAAGSEREGEGEIRLILFSRNMFEDWSEEVAENGVGLWSGSKPSASRLLNG